jgi:hypothetical protein
MSTSLPLPVARVTTVLALAPWAEQVPMFIERKVQCSALFTNLVRWHASAVNFPLSDVILA